MAGTKKVDIVKILKRDRGFIDEAGIKDAGGNSINFCRIGNKIFSPFGEKYIMGVKDALIKPDDIMICGYPKTGCHFVYEILNLLYRTSDNLSEQGKLMTFLEIADPSVPLSMPSPRILNTHHEYINIPTMAKKMKTKIILTQRNPKDTASSYFNHHMKLQDIFNYQGKKFSDWLPLFLEGNINNGSYFDYWLSWEQAIKDNPDHPIIVVHFEDTIKDPKQQVRRLAKFLNIEVTEEKVQEIVEKTHISKMRTHYQKQGLPSQRLIRKGAVGDWKNYFTVAQSEELDKLFQSKMSGSTYKPVYEL